MTVSAPEIGPPRPNPLISHQFYSKFLFSVPCDVLHNCHPYANCEWVEAELRNRCVCSPGYEGNGIECSPHEVSCLDVSLHDLVALSFRPNGLSLSSYSLSLSDTFRDSHLLTYPTYLLRLFLKKSINLHKKNTQILIQHETGVHL